MTFDPKSVEVTCVTLPKDPCVQVPWEYINVCGYSDQFCKIAHTYTYILYTTYIVHSTYILRRAYTMSDLKSLFELSSGETKIAREWLFGQAGWRSGCSRAFNQ